MRQNDEPMKSGSDSVAVGSASFWLIRVRFTSPKCKAKLSIFNHFQFSILQPNVKLNYPFFQKIQYYVQNIENYDNYGVDETDESSKLAVLLIKVEIFWGKLGVGSAS